MMDNNPMVDDTRTYKGQTYRCAGFEDRVRRDGTETVLVRWNSACLTCEEPFTFTAPGASDKIWPNRRCRQHTSPGKRGTRQSA